MPRPMMILAGNVNRNSRCPRSASRPSPGGCSDRRMGGMPWSPPDERLTQLIEDLDRDQVTISQPQLVTKANRSTYLDDLPIMVTGPSFVLIGPEHEGS